MFQEPTVQPLARALEAGRIIPLATPATLDELQRVLNYPQFKVAAERQGAIYAHYAGLVELREEPEEVPPLPKCRDRDDQKFIDLAVMTQAQCLVSKDKLVLKLARRRSALGQLRILPPPAALELLATLAEQPTEQ